MPAWVLISAAVLGAFGVMANIRRRNSEPALASQVTFAGR
jgi:hypothetical protein